MQSEKESIPDKRKYWEEEYNYDNNPSISWKEFDDNYSWCSRCKSYQKFGCICYAR